MVRITAELISARGRQYDRLLGVATIENIGGDLHVADYKVTITKMAPQERQAWKTGTMKLTGEDLEVHEAIVTGFDRVRRGVWDLLFLASKAVGLDRRNEQRPLRQPRT